MRITGGNFKGRVLNIPKGLSLRPTKEQVREAIFSMVEIKANFKILDLYAGSGALGLEAYSRGAKSVLFVEKDPKVVLAINTNLELLQIKASCSVLRSSAESFLKKNLEIFDLVFCDPPYLEVDHNLMLKHLLKRKIGERIVYELPTNYLLDQELVALKNKTYGDTRVMIF